MLTPKVAFTEALRLRVRQLEEAERRLQQKVKAYLQAC